MDTVLHQDLTCSEVDHCKCKLIACTAQHAQRVSTTCTESAMTAAGVSASVLHLHPQESCAGVSTLTLLLTRHVSSAKRQTTRLRKTVLYSPDTNAAVIAVSLAVHLEAWCFFALFHQSEHVNFTKCDRWSDFLDNARWKAFCCWRREPQTGYGISWEVMLSELTDDQLAGLESFVRAMYGVDKLLLMSCLIRGHCKVSYLFESEHHSFVGRFFGGKCSSDNM